MMQLSVSYLMKLMKGTLDLQKGPYLLKRKNSLLKGKAREGRYSAQ